MALTQSALILLVTRRDPQDPVRRILRGVGYRVVSVDSVPAGIRTAERNRPAVIVADPRTLTPANRDDLTSFASENHIPLISSWSDPNSLLAQVEPLLGTPEPPAKEATQLTAGPLRVDFTTHVATIDDRLLDLTAREFDLLCQLARHPGWVWSRQELLEHVWGYDCGDPRVVTVHVGNLRKKLEAAYPEHSLIETVRNIGYKFVVPTVGEPEAAPSTDEREAGTSADTPTGPESFADERRLVTILFLHVAGLTALAETGESLRELVNLLSERLVPCVERYGGGIQRLSADSAMALFGAPLAHDNDAEAAVRAARDIVSAVAGFDAENPGDGLTVHVGVNTGTVVAGAVGGETGQKYAVVGDAVDVASCLAELSGPGEILIGPETLRLVGDILDAEPAGTVTVRGRSDEVPYYRVRDVGHSRSVRETPFGMTSELVGREDQLALFQASLERLTEGAGSVHFVYGEAGVGKSRLTAEVREAATSRGLKWLEGRTLSYGQTMSYLPFKEILQADCGIEADDPMSTRERKLQERMEFLFADKYGEFSPMLANLIGLTTGRAAENPLNWPDEEDVRRMLFDRLTRYVRRLGTERPVVLAFEDVHWLDQSSAALIGKLFPLTALVPVLFCLVGRGDDGSQTLDLLRVARQDEGVHCVAVPLAPLSSKHTQELIRNLLGGSEIDPSVTRMIEGRAEGNPFFVEEVLRHLIDTGSLARDERGRWQVTTTATVPVPSTLQGLIAARIDRLPEATKQELLRASVIGRSFFYELVRSLTPADGAELDSHLAYLQDHQLIFVKQREPELEYAFKHSLLQEAAYGTMLTKQRRELHLKVAQAIEELFSGRIKDLYGILAYHYTQAEDWDKAQDYLLNAGDQSVSMAADVEAVAHYQQAMAALLRAFDESFDDPDSHDRVAWFVRRTEPFWLARCMGDLLDSAQVFHDKVSTACGPVDPRTLAATTVLAGCYFQRGLYEEAALMIERALGSLEESGRVDDPSLSRLLLLLGLSQLNTDRFAEGEDVLERALELESRKPTGDEGLLQDLHIYLSSAHFLTGRHDGLRRVAEEALQKFDLEGTQRFWMLLINLCSSNLVIGNWDEAAAQAQRCMDGITNPVLRAIAARHLGEVRYAQGAYLEAEEHLRYSVATLEELGDPGPRVSALTDLAEIQLQTGKPDKAEETAQKAIALMETALSADYSDVAAAYWTLAGVEMARGRLADAERLLQRSAEVVDEKYSPRHPFCSELYFRRAQLRGRQGRTAEAHEDLRQAIGVLTDIGGEDHPRIGQMKAGWEVQAPES